VRLPRGVSGEELAQRLAKLGYRRIMQVGSHVRLFMEGEPGHRITIPLHKDLRVATLNRILSAVASHIEIDKAELIERLWGK